MSNLLRPILVLAIPFALVAPAQAGSAQATSPVTTAPAFTQLAQVESQSGLPFATTTCQPGQVLNVLGESCLAPGVLPAPPPSLLGSLPPPPPSFVPPLTPLFPSTGSSCVVAGQVLQDNGAPCIAGR